MDISDRFLVEHCRTRVHCAVCRSSPAWRVAVGMPDDCPCGITADDLPAVRDAAAIVAERLAVCNACGNAACSIKHQTVCRRRAILARENFHCPVGHF